MTALLILGAVAGWPCWSAAQSSDATDATIIDPMKEARVKAAYIYGFGRYTTWPASSFLSTNGHFVIGVVGESPLTSSLRHVANTQRIHHRKIEIRTFESINDYQPCHILYIPGDTSTETASDFMRKLQDKPVLLVGDSPGFASSGGVIGFYMANATVRFEINLDTARLHKIRFDSRLMSLARIINADQTAANGLQLVAWSAALGIAEHVFCRSRPCGASGQRRVQCYPEES